MNDIKDYFKIVWSLYDNKRESLDYAMKQAAKQIYKRNNQKNIISIGNYNGQRNLYKESTLERQLK